MSVPNFLIRKLLRLITPEEIGEIATKHNGGKFLTLTDLVSERFDHDIHRDFTSPTSVDDIHDDHNLVVEAKILPFTKSKNENEKPNLEDNKITSLTEAACGSIEVKSGSEQVSAEVVTHKEDENMSSFILIEKARLKRSQETLKKKEIIDLYQKNSVVEVEQIKNTKNNLTQEADAGVLVNKKHY